MLRRIQWVTSIFLIATPLSLIYLIPNYFAHHEPHWATFAFAFFFWIVCSICITGGYHRLLAHKTFESATWFKVLNLFFGAGAFQGSAMEWCTDHRRHHRKVDSLDDPYTITRGFWYAHMGWLLVRREPEYEGVYAPDLKADFWVLWQHRLYPVVATVAGFGVPTLVGWTWGDAWGGFVFGGVLRTVVGHHTTFFINSLAHMWGRQTYSDKVSARDNPVLAVLTNGEGYHNFHHTFEADYRNGIRWYHWDPTKWLIKSLSLVGQTQKLKVTPPQAILTMRLRMEQKQLSERHFQLSPMYTERLEQMRQQIERAQKRWRELKDEYHQMRRDFSLHSQERMIQMRAELELARIEFRKSMRQWASYTKILRGLPAV